MFVKTGACVTAADTSISPSRNSGFPYYGTCEEEVADEGVGGCCLERRSFVGALSSLCKDDCDEDISNDVPSCRAKTVECVCARFLQKCHSDLLYFRILKFSRCEVAFGGTHLESIVVAFDETSMCL